MAKEKKGVWPIHIKKFPTHYIRPYTWNVEENENAYQIVFHLNPKIMGYIKRLAIKLFTPLRILLAKPKYGHKICFIIKVLSPNIKY